MHVEYVWYLCMCTCIVCIPKEIKRCMHLCVYVCVMYVYMYGGIFQVCGMHVWYVCMYVCLYVYGISVLCMHVPRKVETHIYCILMEARY